MLISNQQSPSTQVRILYIPRVPPSSHSPTAEATDLSPVKCRFESDWEYSTLDCGYKVTKQSRGNHARVAGIGRRAALKMQCPQGREGSTPFSSTFYDII